MKPRVAITPTPNALLGPKAILFHPTCLAIALYATIVWQHLIENIIHSPSCGLGAVASLSFFHPRCLAAKSKAVPIRHPSHLRLLIVHV
jgi:hypothetical protein